MHWLLICVLILSFGVLACDFDDPTTLNVGGFTQVQLSRTNLNSIQKKHKWRTGQIYGYSLYDIDAQPVSLSKFHGKVLLLVNTASRCGYTPQYGQLQQLYEKYQHKGFEVLAFPSNDFGGQELATNEQVATFCYTRYSVDFPLFAKTRIKGTEKHPLYKYLTEQSRFPGEVRWNFEKFLIDRSGRLISRYYSSVVPLSDQIIEDVELALKMPS